MPKRGDTLVIALIISFVIRRECGIEEKSEKYKAKRAWRNKKEVDLSEWGCDQGNHSNYTE
jgi:hypothetical protein